MFFLSGHSNPWTHWCWKGGATSLSLLLPHCCSLLSLHQFWHISDFLLTCWLQTNPKGRKRKQHFSAGLTARNVHGSSKTALFGSRKVLAWLPSGEVSSQAPQAAQGEQWVSGGGMSAARNCSSSPALLTKRDTCPLEGKPACLSLQEQAMPGFQPAWGTACPSPSPEHSPERGAGVWNLGNSGHSNRELPTLTVVPSGLNSALWAEEAAARVKKPGEFKNRKSQSLKLLFKILLSKYTWTRSIFSY